MKYDLSICIPARNEMFLSRTVEDILAHKEGKTEIIVLLDGKWAKPAIPDHPDVKVIYYPESIGQRAATNQCVKLSKAKYVLKCDAHTAWDQGFDVKLIKAMEGHDDWTIVPIMKNLWAFDWECPKCGSRWYQGPTPTRCLKNKKHPGDGTIENTECNNTEGFFRTMVWKPNPKRSDNTSYCFDPTPHFQYFKSFKSRPEGQGELTETMSLQGSAFMLTREKYWELNICDERFGSWGSQGIEVAVKTWLSGGRVMVLQTTWYAHLFRTQGLDFGFPYPNPVKSMEAAKKHAKNLFLGNRWEKQVRPMSWLLEKFWPVDYWKDEDLKKLKEDESKRWKPKV